MRIRMVFFFHKSTRILAMPDVRESLIAFYKLLKETFPLEGRGHAPFSAFLAVPLELISSTTAASTSSGRFILFSREQTMFLRAFSLTGGVNATPTARKSGPPRA